MNDELLQIPKRIKELREILEISITEMAEKLNISHDEYEKYESGEKDIPVSALYAIAAALGTDRAHDRRIPENGQLHYRQTRRRSSS